MHVSVTNDRTETTSLPGPSSLSVMKVRTAPIRSQTNEARGYRSRQQPVVKSRLSAASEESIVSAVRPRLVHPTYPLSRNQSRMLAGTMVEEAARVFFGDASMAYGS